MLTPRTARLRQQPHKTPNKWSFARAALAEAAGALRFVAYRKLRIATGECGNPQVVCSLLQTENRQRRMR
jgi:hypothetical protein